MTDRRFAQVDVFGVRAGTGNPVAVVLDGDGLTTARMQELAAWLNVAEATFAGGSDSFCGSTWAMASGSCSARTQPRSPPTAAVEASEYWRA